MAKLDNYNRLLIPRKLIKASDTDFSKEVRLFLRNDELFLDNPSEENNRMCCLGRVNIDYKGRFTVSNFIQKFLKTKEKTDFICYICNGKITFKTILLIPENN